MSKQDSQNCLRLPMSEGDWPMSEGDWPLSEGDWPLSEGDWPMSEGHVYLPTCFSELAL